MKKKKTKKQGVTVLSKIAWKFMSKWVRLRDDGFCYTCGKPGNHAGHFFHARKTNRVSYDGRNVHCQCVSCNSFKSGNLAVYATLLVDDYGTDVLGELERLKKTSLKMQVYEYCAIIELLKEKIEKLEDE